MSSSRFWVSCGPDSRGVAPLIGIILMFGFLVISLSAYQATVVPEQNTGVEFEHFETVQDEMVDVRSAIFQARTTTNPQSTTVTLGTNYPFRLVAFNPPPTTGELATSENGSILIEDQATGADNTTDFDEFNPDDFHTRLLTYEPSYFELDAALPIRHEYSVVYLDTRVDDPEADIVLRDDNQQLVSGNEVVIPAVQREYSEVGSQTVAVDVEPGISETETLSDVSVTVPTKLPEETWERLLADELDADKIVVDEAAEELTLELDGQYDITFAPVGLDEPPASGSP